MSFTKEQLMPGENLIVLSRQHIFVLSRPFFVNILTLVLFVVIAYYCSTAWIAAIDIIPLLYFLWKFLSWRKREYVLTDRRVVKQEGVISIHSFDAPLDKINNVFHQQSFMGRLFKYGDVGLETASEQGTTLFDFISHPLDLKNAIVRQRELYAENPKSPGIAAQKTIPQLIDELASLRDRQIISESEFQEKKKALLAKM